MLEKWKGRKYYMVDPWLGELTIHKNGFKILDHNKAYEYLLSETSKYGNKVKILRNTSSEAAQLFVSNKIQADFVYIDALHDYHSAMKDIRSWWPIVKPGGVLAGHDYDNPIFTCTYAIQEFARKMGLEIYVTHKEYGPPEYNKHEDGSVKLMYLSASWFILKPKYIHV